MLTPNRAPNCCTNQTYQVILQEKYREGEEDNVKRIYWSEWKSTEKAKKRRKHLHALKKGFEDNKEEEGNMYESGAH